MSKKSSKNYSVPSPIVDPKLLQDINSQYEDDDNSQSGDAGNISSTPAKTFLKRTVGASISPGKGTKKQKGGRTVRGKGLEGDSDDSDSKDPDFVCSPSTADDEKNTDEMEVDFQNVAGGRPNRGNMLVKFNDDNKINEMVEHAGGRGKRRNVVRKVKVELAVKDEEVGDGSGKTTNQRVSPRLFMQLVDGLDEAHKQAVRDIGFGGLLHLDVGLHNSEFSEKLIRSVDVDELCINLPPNKIIKLSVKDFQLVYGLPCGGIKISDKDDSVSDRWASFVKTWRNGFGLKIGSPSNSAVFRKLLELKCVAVCDEFIWNFVVLAVNCCIRSTNSPQLSYKFLYNCMDVKQIAKLDWCGFAFNQLFDSVALWHTQNSWFTGPLPFLMIFYFDRLQRGLATMPRICPLTFVWTKDVIRERYIVEKGRGFGKGIVLESFEYVENVETEAPKKKEEVKVAEASSSGPTDMLGFLKNFHESAKKLANHVNDMSVMLDKAGSIFGEGELSVQIRTLINNIWSRYRVAVEDKSKETSDKDVTVEEGESGSPKLLSQDSHFFDCPAFMAELEIVMATAYSKYESEKGPYVKKKSIEELSPPNFDLITQSLPSTEELDESDVSKKDGGEKTAAPKSTDAGTSGSGAEVRDSSAEIRMCSEGGVENKNDHDVMNIDEDKVYGPG